LDETLVDILASQASRVNFESLVARTGIATDRVATRRIRPTDTAC